MSKKKGMAMSLNALLRSQIQSDLDITHQLKYMGVRIAGEKEQSTTKTNIAETASYHSNSALMKRSLCIRQCLFT